LTVFNALHRRRSTYRRSFLPNCCRIEVRAVGDVFEAQASRQRLSAALRRSIRGFSTAQKASKKCPSKPVRRIRNQSFYDGAGSRIRTDDLLITNQLLYQLSYAGVYLGKWPSRDRLGLPFSRYRSTV